jgi:hypothetical protein
MTSNALSQLLDVPDTVFKSLGLQNTVPTEGHSVFDLERLGDRKVHIFSGIYTKNKKGKTRILGRDIDETLLSHVSYQQSKGWQVERDVPAIEN